MMKNTMTLILSAVLLSSCNSQITSFVQGALKPIPIPIPESVATSKAMKVSPGSVQSVGSQVKVNATITPTNRTLTGNQVQATLTISQSRKN